MAYDMVYEHVARLSWRDINRSSWEVDTVATGGDRTSGVYYSLNPNVKLFMRNGRFYWTVKSRGFDSLEEAISDAEGFVMTDLSTTDMERILGVKRSDGYGNVGYCTSKNFTEDL